MLSREILDKIKKYLADRAEQEPNYNNLITEIDAIATAAKNHKPQIKIASRSQILAEKLYQLSISNKQLRSLYDFQIVSPIKNTRQILNHCDFICFIYDVSQSVSEFEKGLIEKSIAANIIVIILVKNNYYDTETPEKFYKWLNQQNFPKVNNLLLPLNHFFNPYITHHINTYHQFVINYYKNVLIYFDDRIIKQIKLKLDRYFALEIKASWQAIRDLRNTLSQGEYTENFKHKIERKFQKIHREKQHFFKKVKQNIHHAKTDVLNPFSSSSLMHIVQQEIQKAEIKQSKKQQEVNLYLVIKKDNFIENLHIHILNLCQENINYFIDKQWQQINYTYEKGGLNQLFSTIKTELKILSELYSHEIIFTLPTPSSFEISKIICSKALQFNSEIPFEYHYTQSSWFKLFVSLVIGASIYLFTKILLGNGRYFGFIILIYQLINLFTGQDIKNIKLKQHTKELKRIIDSKYQTLVRFCIDKVIQDFIATLDEENQKYQQQLDTISLSVNQELTQIKQTISQSKARIENLKQDQAEIISLLSVKA